MVTKGGTVGGSVQLGIAQRANLTRIDVLSVKSDTGPLPPISLTVVIDRSANTLTAWNDAIKQYKVQPFIPRVAPSPAPRRSASPKPTASPRPAVRGTSPFANLDILAVTLKLIGHTTTSGLPTTGLAFDLQVQRKGESEPVHVTATTQLADEFPIFPMTLDASIEPGAQPFSAKLSYAVDDLTRETPPLSRFTVPRGYKEAPSLLNVIFRPTTAAPRPSPAPTPK
jgi:hypothetical protein